MNAMKRRFLLPLLGVGILVLLIGALMIFSFYTENRSHSINDASYWESRIEDRGAEVAYQEFVTENNNAPIGEQHVHAHIIGETLFETIGIRGIAVCDASFGFGCFHGLFTRGFAREGISFVKEADRMCIDRFGPLGTGCQHGVGHGIVEYVGHEDIHEALALCEHTTQPATLLGCTSGVFMERNTPFTVIPGEEPQPPLAFNAESPYGLCDGVSEEYKAVCYYELGAWWEVVLQDDIEVMGSLCTALTNEEYRTPCFLGIGKIIGHTRSYDSVKSEQACERASVEHLGLCMGGAAWSMYSHPEHNIKALGACEQLTGVQETLCKRYTNVVEYEETRSL